MRLYRSFMRNRVGLSVIPLVTVFLTQVALAQSGPASRDEIRDPEVLLPAQSESGQPCVIDAAAIQDPRINRDVLRVMQTNPYYARSSPQRIARYVEVWKDKSRTSTWDHRYRTVGCGFYVEDRTFTYRTMDGRYNSVDVSTALVGPGGDLFSESKDTTRSAYGRLKTEIKMDWRQMTSLQVIGSRTPVTLGNRYGTRSATMTKFGHGYSSSYECQVTEQRAAAEFHPRLTGKAFLETCKYESYDASDRSRSVSTSTSVSFPDVDKAPSFDPGKCRLEWRSASEFNPRWPGDAFLTRCTSGQSSSVWFPDQHFSFDPEKCRLELRGASEFNRNLHGEAFATRCAGSSSNSVYFPELERSFSVDTIDGSFRSDPKERKLLLEVELAQ